MANVDDMMSRMISQQSKSYPPWFWDEGTIGLILAGADKVACNGKWCREWFHNNLQELPTLILRWRHDRADIGRSRQSGLQWHMMSTWHRTVRIHILIQSILICHGALQAAMRVHGPRWASSLICVVSNSWWVMTDFVRDQWVPITRIRSVHSPTSHGFVVRRRVVRLIRQVLSVNFVFFVETGCCTLK